MARGHDHWAKEHVNKRSIPFNVFFACVVYFGASWYFKISNLFFLFEHMFHFIIVNGISATVHYFFFSLFNLLCTFILLWCYFFAWFAVHKDFDWVSDVFSDCPVDTVLIKFVKHCANDGCVLIGEEFSELVFQLLNRIIITLDQNEIESFLHQIVCKWFAGFVAGSINNRIRLLISLPGTRAWMWFSISLLQSRVVGVFVWYRVKIFFAIKEATKPCIYLHTDSFYLSIKMKCAGNSAHIDEGLWKMEINRNWSKISHS